MTILNAEEEIYAHFNEIEPDNSIEVTGTDWLTVVDVKVVKSIDTTTDSSCNSFENYAKSSNSYNNLYFSTCKLYNLLKMKICSTCNLHFL